MASLLNISSQKSSPTHPFKFFDWFYYSENLPKIRLNFFETLCPSENVSLYLFTQNDLDDYIEIEYSEEEYDPDNPNKTYRSWQKVKRYYFRDELTEFLKTEYYKSIRLLESKINGSLKKENIKNYLANEVKKIITHFDLIATNDFYLNYRFECERPLKAIIRQIYRSYPIYVPRADRFLSTILNESPEINIDYTPSELNTSLAKEILCFKDKNDDLIFFNTLDEIDEAELRENLLNFIRGNFSEINQPIIFTKNIEAVHYFIHKVATIGSYKLKEIENAKIIQLKGNLFKADTCSKSKSSFIAKNPSLQHYIDILLKKNSN